MCVRVYIYIYIYIYIYVCIYTNYTASDLRIFYYCDVSEMVYRGCELLCIFGRRAYYLRQRLIRPVCVEDAFDNFPSFVFVRRKFVYAQRRHSKSFPMNDSS